MSVVAIIPARYASTRFPGKPLAEIMGKSMIEHVYRRVCRADTIDRVIIATDDQRIFRQALKFGAEVVMTSAHHPSGTDRLAEVATDLEADLVVNVQGDEPLIVPQMIDEAVSPLLADPKLQMGTLCNRIEILDDYLSPNVVKLVRDQQGRALYFSRAPIPVARDMTPTELGQQLTKIGALRHIGLYVYRRDFLLRYARLPQTPLETLESLEQLRALEHGIPVYAALTDYTCQGVDTRDDLLRVKKIMQQSGEF
jgi:3-deoxy-manno-octulosonate cytidylyltransferase (CMP-KDO synthetase)